MINDENINLENFGRLEFRQDTLNNATCEIRHTNITEDEYREVYPSLTLSEEQAVTRSRQYKIIQRIQVKRKSVIQRAVERIDTWSSVNTIISVNYGKDSCIYFKLSRWMASYATLVSMASIFFLVVPMTILYNKSRSNDPQSQDYISNLLNVNENWLTDTPLFFGYYNQTQGFDSTFVYSISRAYFWVNILTRLIYILAIMRKFIFIVSTVYTENYFTSMLESTTGAHSILSMWDFRSSTKRGAMFSTINIRDFISKMYSSTKMSRRVTTSLNAMINIVSFGLIAVTLERISWIITDDETLFQNSQALTISVSDYLRCPIALSIIIISATWIFDLVKCIEQYERKYVTILVSSGRILMLNCGISILLIFHWSKLLSCTRPGMAVSNNTMCHLLRGPVAINPNSLLHVCWETWLGQRIFLYILVNIVISFLFYFLIDIAKSILKFSSSSFIKPRFFYSAFMGNLCYMDCLFWLGFYYSPVLSIVWLLTVLLLFFYNINVISVSCFPRGSSSENVNLQKMIFTLMLLVSSSIGICTLISHSVLFKPSRSCGPFSHLEYNFSPENFNPSVYFLENNFLKKVIDIGDQLLLSDGLWYSITIVFLSLAFQFIFRVNALRKICNLALGDKTTAIKDRRRAAENCESYMEKLKAKQSSFNPSKKSSEDEKIEEEFNNFVIS